MDVHLEQKLTDKAQKFSFQRPYARFDWCYESALSTFGGGVVHHFDTYDVSFTGQKKDME